MLVEKVIYLIFEILFLIKVSNWRFVMFLKFVILIFVILLLFRWKLVIEEGMGLGILIRLYWEKFNSCNILEVNWSFLVFMIGLFFNMRYFKYGRFLKVFGWMDWMRLVLRLIFLIRVIILKLFFSICLSWLYFK